MGSAVLISGFNNWGKSTIIHHLFRGRPDGRYRSDRPYRMTHVNFNTEFFVESHSNDDWIGVRWINLINNRFQDHFNQDTNLVSALCPSIDPNNDFRRLLAQAPFSNFSKIHIFLLEYKYDHFAKLLTRNIISSCQLIPNVNIIVINADAEIQDVDERLTAKIAQIRAHLNRIFS